MNVAAQVIQFLLNHAPMENHNATYIAFGWFSVGAKGMVGLTFPTIRKSEQLQKKCYGPSATRRIKMN
jgi:hypothetical protein